MDRPDIRHFLGFLRSVPSSFYRPSGQNRRGVLGKGSIMGIYLNPGDDNFCMAHRSQIYVDKSAMLGYLNDVFQTQDRFVCVSRPRRFGKSTAANMVTAYYDRTANAEDTFQGLQFAQDESFATHCNKYDVIHIKMTKTLFPIRFHWLIIRQGKNTQ